MRNDSVESDRSGSRFLRAEWLSAQDTGSATIKLYSPKFKKTFEVNFDIVPEKLLPILRYTAMQQTKLITLEMAN